MTRQWTVVCWPLVSLVKKKQLVSKPSPNKYLFVFCDPNLIQQE